jgi:adenosylhomocysteine nucleosidase
MKLRIQICSEFEWENAKSILKIKRNVLQRQLFGEYFARSFGQQEWICYHSGATKTRAAAACQFAIDTWHPNAIVNLGTCGGVIEEIRKLDIIMADKTTQYDCIIRFGEPREIFAPANLFYKPMITVIDTSWVDISGVSRKIRKGTIASADQDLNVKWRERLRKENVLGADWESGAISKVCELNKMKCLILRGVTDIPDGNQESDCENNTPIVMESLLQILTQIRFL